MKFVAHVTFFVYGFYWLGGKRSGQNMREAGERYLGRRDTLRIGRSNGRSESVPADERSVTTVLRFYYVQNGRVSGPKIVSSICESDMASTLANLGALLSSTQGGGASTMYYGFASAAQATP